jgi:hypothetical protein
MDELCLPVDFAAEPMAGNDSIAVNMAPGSEVDNCKGEHARPRRYRHLHWSDDCDTHSASFRVKHISTLVGFCAQLYP